MSCVDHVTNIGAKFRFVKHHEEVEVFIYICVCVWCTWAPSLGKD